MDENDTLGEPGTVDESATVESAVDRLAGILDDPDDEPDTGEDEAHAEEGEDIDGADEVADEVDASEEDSAEEAEGKKTDEPEPTGGRFVEHTARVKLPSGETTTVADLLKGTLRQSDYTRKTQEIAETRKAVESEKERVGQTAQQLREQHDRMTAMLEQWKPQPPQDPKDYAAWIEYKQQSEAFERWQEAIDTEGKQLRERNDAEQAEAIKARMSRENELLVQKFSAMADPAKRATFLDEAVKVLSEYGFGKEDIGSIGDHRLILVIRDLMRAKRLGAKAPAVKEKMQEKPKMVRGGKRGSDPAADQRRARIERLRETGSRADGVRSLMDLDL